MRKRKSRSEMGLLNAFQAEQSSSSSLNMFSSLVNKGSSFVMEGVKNLVVKKQHLPITKIVDEIMEVQSALSTRLWCFVLFSLRSSGHQLGCTVVAVSAQRPVEQVKKIINKTSRPSGWHTMYSDNRMLWYWWGIPKVSQYEIRCIRTYGSICSCMLKLKTVTISNFSHYPIVTISDFFGNYFSSLCKRKVVHNVNFFGMQIRQGPYNDDYAYFDPKILRGNMDNIPRAKNAFQVRGILTNLLSMCGAGSLTPGVGLTLI